MVVTRRSRSNLNEDDESVANSNVEQSERDPLLSSIPEQLARRPPPPPPPPMPTAVTGSPPATAPTTQRPVGTNTFGSVETNINRPRTQREDLQVNQPEQPIVQYLKVRVAAPSYRPTKIFRRHRHAQQSHKDSRQMHKRREQPNAFDAPSAQRDIVRVLIPTEGFVSEQQLSECLSQACNADNDRRQTSMHNYSDDRSWDSTEEYFEERKANVAGMFLESDGVFVPLSIIYSQPRAFTNDVLSMNRPIRSEDRRPVNKSDAKSSIFVTFLEIVGIVAVTCASWMTYSATQRLDWDMATNKLESIFLAVVNIPFYLFAVMIEFPLRELYRHGPSLIGWEGESLARICSRVTHYGDEDFWKRNMEECEEIYASKEAAAMQIRKPALIGVIVLILFYMVKSIVEAQAMRRQHLDPNMVETYRAITMLARQLKRAVNTNR